MILMLKLLLLLLRFCGVLHLEIVTTKRSSGALKLSLCTGFEKRPKYKSIVHSIYLAFPSEGCLDDEIVTTIHWKMNEQ